MMVVSLFFFFQAEDGIRDIGVTGVQTCALPISIASPSTSTLRSGTVSRFSGGGALEKSSRITFFGACCCWNGVKKSPPNQPPPPPRGCCRCGPPKLPKLLPKLKNCAEAGPAIPTNRAAATASAASGPGSVKARKKDFVFGMRLGRNGSLGNHYYSGIRPQAGRFLTINRASAAAVKIAAALGVFLRRRTGAHRPLSPFSTVEEAHAAAS